VKLAVPNRSGRAGFLLASLGGRTSGSLAACGILLGLVLGMGIIAPDISAQRGAPPPISDPAQALEDTLTAACRHDEAAFANHLTSGNAQAYGALTQEQRVALLKRFVLLEDPGKPLLSALDGHKVLRCEAAGVTSEMRFGATEVRENLAFIPVSVPEGADTQSVRFGFVRESGQWKLLSVGLLLLDIPALGRQWEESDLQARERSAIAALRKVRSALKSYQRAYGNLPDAPVPIKFNEFQADTQEIGHGVVMLQPGWETVLENNKQAFTLDFVQRSRFTLAYATSLTPPQFVNQLFTNAGVTPSTADRNAAIAEFGSATNTTDVAARARALRDVAENAILNTQEFNRAFVLMQYFGYLRRNPNDPQDPDYTGWEFWLAKLNQFNGNFVNAEMVKAFITSTEYRQRFGP